MEVSGKVIGLFREIATRTETSVEAMLEGLDLPIDPSRDPARIEWSTLCTLCRRATLAAGGVDRLAALGASIVEAPEFTQTVKVVRLVASAKLLYWVSMHWGGPSLFSHLDNRYEERRDGTLRLTITIPAGYEVCPEFFYLTAGFNRALPRVMALPDAYVEVTITDGRRCVYDVDPPPSWTLWARFRLALQSLFSARSTLAALTEQQTLLQRRFVEVQTARRQAEAALDSALTARDIAQRALETRSRFLATMSHELRTPMNGVIGAASLLSTTPLQEQQLEFVDTIQTCSDTLLALINDVLDLSKLEAGKVDLEEVGYQLGDLVDEVLTLVAYRRRHSRAAVTAEVGATVPRWLRGDPVRVRQVLTNLVDNAVKFTEEGHVSIRVDWAPDQAQGDRLRFEVEDTGIGIEAEALDDLFSRFTQADSSTTRRFGGSGLGLAISKHIVEMMDGSIGVRSRPGEGSTFWFELPVSRATASEMVPRREPTPQPQPLQRPHALGVQAAAHEAPARSRGRVLVVDDNEVNLMIAGRLVSRMGYEVAVARGGLEALDIARASRFDLILMDCHMPGMDGFATSRELKRAGGASSGSPIAALTACAMPEDRRRCEDAGMDAYIAKPVDSRKLEALLARWARPLPDAGRGLLV